MNTEDNVFQGKLRQICIPVGGPTGTGKYYIQAICDPECRLSRAELELVQTSKLEPEKFLGKRLVVVRDEKSSDELPQTIWNRSATRFKHVKTKDWICNGALDWIKNLQCCALKILKIF